jgi:preprotein translocase subunit SecE
MAKINPGEFMRQVQTEGRKVVWPTRQETVTTAIFVAIMMVILALFFLGIDTLFGKIVQFLLSLAG